MAKFDNEMIYDEIKALSIKDKDLIIVKINTSVETDVELDAVKSTVSNLADILRNSDINNPIVILGSNANIETMSPEMMAKFGYYKKDIETDEEDIDDLYN